GMSMGGMITQEVAIRYPERVMAIILAATSTDADRPYTEEEIEKLAGYQGNPKMREVLCLEEGEYKANIDNVDVVKFFSIVTELGFNKRIYRMLIKPAQKIYARRIGADVIREQFRAVLSLDTLDRLHMIEAPTLVICGTEDKIIPTSASEILASKIPNAKLVKIEKGSHSIH
ncbi:MAG: alpha/beta hydrolase, partial [bacterium]|nr:alpha/beta hydrolase [bacterium]